MNRQITLENFINSKCLEPTNMILVQITKENNLIFRAQMYYSAVNTPK